MLGFHYCGSFSLAMESGDYLLVVGMCFSLRWLLSSQSIGSRPTVFSSCSARAWQLWFPGSRDQAPGLSYSVACGIFLDQGSNTYLLHWQVDSLPLSHQGSPCVVYLDMGQFICDAPKSQVAMSLTKTILNAKCLLGCISDNAVVYRSTGVLWW